MAEEFKVKVGVEVDTAGLDAQIAKIKPSNKIKCDVELNDASVQHIVDQLNNGIKAFGKNGNEIKFTADVTGLKKDVASAVKGVTGKSAANNIKVNADTSAAQNKISNLNNVVENGKVNFEQFKKVMQSSQFAKFDLNDEEIKVMAKSLNDLGITIKGLDIDFKDDHTLNFKATGIDELKQDVKDVVTYARQADEAMEEIAPKGSVKVYKDNSAKEAAAAKQAAAQAKAAAQEQAAAEKQVAEAARQAAKEQAAAAQIAANAKTQRQKLIDTYKAEKQSEVDVDSKYNKINNPSEDLIKAYNAYKNAKKNLFDTENFADDVVAVNQYNAALETVKNQLSIVANKERDAATAAKAEASAQKEAAAAMQLRSKANNLSMSMDAWLKRNSAAAKTFGGQIRSLQAELKSCDATRFSGIQSEFKTITTQAEIIGKTGLSMGNRLKMQFTKLSSYFGAASVIMTGIQTVKEGFQNVLDVDTKLTELYRVTDFTSSQYSDVYDTLTISAQKYGATLTDLISQTADWSRAGFNDPDQAAGLAEITSVYQHIADLDADTSMENLLTAYKGFESELKETYGNDATAAATHIADIYNEIDNNYATTAADIGEAVKRSASALSLAGNSLEETAGMVTGITEVTQDPEKAGNSLKVLSMRLRGMKGELQDLGEETDENVENLSQMQGKVLNLTHGKVNIFDNAGDFKSTYEIMQGIADIYDDLTDSDKADLLETIAGKNRANEVAALIQNWDRVAQATESAENSAGSAMAEQEKYANSLQGRLNSLTSSLQTISNTALDSGFLKGLVSGATEAINILNKVIDTIGIIPTVATVAGAAMSLSGKKFFDFHIDEQTGELKAFGKTAQTIFSSIKNAFSGIGQIVGEVFNKINSKFQSGGQVFDFNSVKIDGSYGGMRFVKNLDNDIAKLKEFKTLMSKMQSELKDGMSIDVNDVIEQSMSGASDRAKEFAKTWDLSNEAIGEFSKKSLEATGVISKTSSSMTNAKNIISAYNNLVDKSGQTQSKFASAISTFNPQLGSYLSGLDGAEASLAGYGVQLAFATVKTFALQAATLALNAALSMGIGMLISAGVSALMSWINAEDELADKVKDITTEYGNQKKELKDAKATINEVADSYAELSKGVDTSTNENINLDTDEYQQYLDIVNQIGDTFPELISGYDAQGNAILTCAGNVDKLTEAYNKLEKTNNNKIIDEAEDVAKDSKNKADDVFNKDKWKQGTSTEANLHALNTLEGLTKSNDLKKAINKMSFDDLVIITDALSNYGEKYDQYSGESIQKFIARVITENKETVNKVLSETKSSMQEAASGMQDIAEATIGNAFIDGKYKNISGKMQSYINGMIPNMDYEFFNSDKIKWDANKLNDYINDMLNTINSLDDGQQKKFEIFFDMKSKLNSGDCTVGEYVKSVNDVKNVIKNSGLDKDMQYQLQMSLGIKDDDTVKQVKDFKKKLINAGKSEDVANEIVNGLTKTELEAAVSLKLKLKDMNVNDIKKAIADEAKYLEAMDFDIDIAGETDSLDKLNSALAESKSATGLTADSIDALNSRYQGLKGAGYDAAKLFEETSNGVRLNTQEYTKLEQAYAQGKLKDATSNLEYLRDKYNDLTGQIATCTDAEERANLVSKQEDIRQKINDLGELAAQYEGLASKYNAWQNAESAGSDRDMYENVLKGFEEVDDELSRGWLDDASKAFIDMFSYDQLNSIDDYTNRWKTLGNTIDGTTYSVKDFFTQNKDGESTNDGVYNFLEAVDQLGQGNIKRGENGEIISFDFGVNGEEAIAKTMGISKELVQIIERAAEDAGFVIDMDGTYTNFADLQKAAVESNKKINELAQSSEKLKKLGLDNYTFHFDSTDAETVFNDLNKAKEMLDTFRRDDGTIDLSVDGAQDALNIARTLQAAYDKLADPVYMQLDASQVDDSMKKPLQLMQEYRTQQKKLNQMKLQGVDTSEVDKSMSDIVDEIAKLDDDTKVKFGIDVDASKEDIKKQLDSGDLTIDATVDLQVEANDTLNDIKLLTEHQAGLITDDQLKIGLELDTSSVDDYTEKEATKIVKFLPENTDFLDNLGLDDDKKKVVVDFVSDNADFLNDLDLKDGEKEILLRYVAENPDLLKDLDKDQKKIAIDFVVNNQDLLKDLDEEDKQVAIDYIVKNPDVLDGLSNEDKQVKINAIVSGKEGIDQINNDIKGLSDKQIQVIAKTLGNIDVENLKSAVAGLSDKQVQAIATAMGKGDVDGLKSALDGMSDKQVQAIATALGFSDVESLKSAVAGLDGKQVQAVAQALGISDVDSLRSAVNGLDGKTVEAVANAIGAGSVTSLQGVIDSLKGKTVNVVANLIGSAASFLSGGGSKANGTAHVNGTAYVNGTTGKAFKNGNWGAKEDGAALMGELGQEIVVRNGRWFTVGDNGAEFVGYKKGDIVFNHKQSEELLRNGYVTSGGGRGRALASGTAFGRGSGGIGRANKGSSVKTSSSSSSSSKSSSSSSSNSNSNSSANEEAEKFEETLDWIETALDRVERAISRLDKTATSTYKNWTKRGTALNDQISQTRREIDLQNQAYNRYIQQANSVGLDAGYAAKVRDGTIDIEKITDEDLNNKIQDYQNWYNKALDCLDAIDDLRESESKLYEQRFENVSTKYDGYLGVIQHEKDMLDEFVSQTETAGYITSGKYYDAMSANAKKQQEELKKQRDEMISELNNAVNSGTIEKYSESWYSMVNSVDEVTKSIEECNTSLLEYKKNLRELDWQIFDLIQDKISKVADESEFLINLMSNKKLYEDNGQLTDEGMATMGQYGVKYNVYMAQANKYAKKIKALQADLAKDPYNQDIANQLQEYIEAQQEAILNAEDMKNSIKDMVSEGIDKELSSLQKLIDKRNDALDSAKDLYDYQKKLKESTKDIADLEKQMAAYQGDVSEETKAKIQQIKVDLEEAKSDLEETEYEQYISDQQKMLDDLYTDYETILNQRLDDIDALMADMISEINNNASTIGATIESQADKVGYTLSESMNTIWLSGNGSISNVITMYGTKFDTALTTTNTALGYINTNIQNMITQLNKLAGTKIKAAGASSAATEKPTPKPSSTPTQQQQQQQQKKQVTVGGTINAGGARIYADSYGNGGGRQTFGSDPIYTVLQERNGYILTRWHKLSSGYTGWFKKSDVSAYALGAKNIRNNEMAWTQENGSEMIMRPSDGAILTPLAKNDSVLTSAASSNIWNMANNPSDFIKDNLDLDKIDTGANVGNKTTYTQNLDKVVFNLPNVKNYDELLKSMQHDKNFERLIMSMTIDPIAGKSSLAKGKAIR